MAEHSTTTTTGTIKERLSGVQLHIPMTARSTTEAHRAASQLELLFDLTFVIAVASIARQLAHGLADGGALPDVIPFFQVFFAIWWAWMNFTWFASSYDTDDVIYRVLAMLQMAGVLVLAAGVPAALEHNDYWGITLGYLIMRVGLVALWIRAAIECPSTRGTALRYAIGITALEIAWISRQVLAAPVLPEGSLLPIFVGLVLAEVSVPWWAERTGRSAPTSWHPDHIAERYGLFVILLLGEGLLAASSGVPAAINGGAGRGSIIAMAIGGFAMVMTIWWLYFVQPAGPGLAEHRSRSFWWGYVHYGVFAALAAVGAGLEVAVEHVAGHSESSQSIVDYAIALPAAAFIIVLTAANAALVPLRLVLAVATAVAVLIVLALPLLPVPGGVAGLAGAIAGVCVILIAATFADSRQAQNHRAVAPEVTAQAAEMSNRA